MPISLARQPGAVVRAMHHDAARAHRFETGEAVRDPVLGGDRFDGKRSCRRVTGHKRDKSPKFSLVGVGPKMDRNLPTPIVAFERRTGGVLGIEAFAEIGCQPAGSRFVASKLRDGGGRVHRAATFPFAFARAMVI